MRFFSAGSAKVCVCVSQTLFRREVNLLLQVLCCFCSRGTQEAHRAVSNEALYGVFRISGLITLTYLLVLKLLTSCYNSVFPSIRTKNPSLPSTFALGQLFRVFSFFNWFNLEWAKFIQLWFCAVNYSWPSINFHAAFFPSLKLHGLWQAIHGHYDTLVAQKIVETLYLVFVTYQVWVCVIMLSSDIVQIYELEHDAETQIS